MPRRYLPALRGRFGDWAYYSCLVSLRELADRVTFAKEIHKSRALSDIIQRQLKEGRSAEISEYLRTNPEWLFNSLVVAVYEGDPAWHELAEIRPEGTNFDPKDVSEDAVASIGFLSFTGEEKLFALDGQHRLAGIQKALEHDPELADDEASVIFVSHHSDAAGLTRTRRLFTTLNKTARPVSKIIALDEDDVMAIVARDLVENENHFSEQRVLILSQSNLPATDQSHWTTIVNLYDVLTILFSKVKAVVPLDKLQFHRPNDEVLREYREFAVRYFDCLATAFPELEEYFGSDNPEEVVRRHRHAEGGSVLFRPVGLVIFANLAAAAGKDRTLEEVVGLLARLPTDLSAEPYRDLLWNSAARKMDLRRQVLVRRLLLYVLGLIRGTNEIAKLKADVARVRGIEPNAVTLPEKVV